MRKLLLPLLVFVSFSSNAQKPVDAAEIKKYVDSINTLVAKWTTHDPVLSVDTSGKSMILHKDGSRFVFDLSQMEESEFHGIELNVYDPRTRPAEQHFIYFRGQGASGGLIRFEKIPEEMLRQIFGLCVELRRLFL
jgi:hypothetical protein